MARILVDRPHWGWPFVREGTGGVRVVEQDSDDHIQGQEYALVMTPLGWRPERPEYGWPWPEFSMVPIDLEPLRQAIRRFVPDSNARVEEYADLVDATIRRIRILEQSPNDPERSP